VDRFIAVDDGIAYSSSCSVPRFPPLAAFGVALADLQSRPTSAI
jgi:hypothetical protein